MNGVDEHGTMMQDSWYESMPNNSGGDERQHEEEAEYEDAREGTPKDSGSDGYQHEEAAPEDGHECTAKESGGDDGLQREKADEYEGTLKAQKDSAVCFSAAYLEVLMFIRASRSAAPPESISQLMDSRAKSFQKIGEAHLRKGNIYEARRAFRSGACFTKARLGWQDKVAGALWARKQEVS